MSEAAANILWICADDFTPFACGPYGNRIVRTPNLDRLAKQSVRFDRAYCTAPLSTPSRQSFLTGKFPWTIGVTRSVTPLPDDETTGAERLGAAGYFTAAFGKTHYYHDLKHRFDIAVDHSDHQQWLAKLEQSSPAAIAPGTAVLPEWRPFYDHAAIWLNSMGLPYGSTDERMYGTYLARQAADFLSRNHNQPFCAFVAFHETHSPFHFPVDFGNRCSAANIVPPDPPSDSTDVPLVFEDLTQAEKQGIIASYYMSASFMDKNFGIVLDALDASDLADRTLVIFTSDHGYMLGQRGRFEKHCCYEPAIRVPLFMRLPDGTAGGQSRRELVSLIDLVPTLLEFCGIEQPSELPGRSLLPLMTGRGSDGHDFVVAHYSGNEEACLVDERWKVIYRTGNHLRTDGYRARTAPNVATVELYDLQDDPEETRNLAVEPAERQRAECMLARLADHMQATARQPVNRSSGASPRDVLNACLRPSEFQSAVFAAPVRPGDRPVAAEDR
jgi:choline-sulfatase